MRILAIDPSLVNIGIAEIHNGKYKKSYTFRTDKRKNVLERLKEIYEHFNGLEGKYNCVVVEEAGNFVRMGTYGVRNMDSIQLLMLATGTIVGSLLGKYPVEFMRVKDWKGNTPKAVTQSMARHLTNKKLNTHESDATIMGINFCKSKLIKKWTANAKKKKAANPKELQASRYFRIRG